MLLSNVHEKSARTLLNKGLNERTNDRTRACILNTDTFLC